MTKIWCYALLLLSFSVNSQAVNSQAVVRYMAPSNAGGSDSNNGLTTETPWASPNHAMNCGDVIIAAVGTYSNYEFIRDFGTSTCASGNDVAWVKCATFDGCKISQAYGGVWITASYWGVQGFEVTVSGPISNNYACFLVSPPIAGTGPLVHHVIFANDVANGCLGGAFTLADEGSYGVDYVALLTNIAYNGAQSNSQCYSGIDIGGTQNLDTLPGTHIYIAGNFSWANFEPNPCGGTAPTDGHGIMFDTLDNLSFTGQSAVVNNILFLNGADGVAVIASTQGHVYIEHNTTSKNNTDTDLSAAAYAEIGIQDSANAEVAFNLTVANPSNGPGGVPGYIFQSNGSSASVFYSGFGYTSVAAHNTKTDNGFTFGPNNVFGTDPAFVNAPASNPGAPSCGSYASVPACMATLIADFVPTVAAAKPYGYQTISTTSVYNPLYPQWLCSVTNLPIGLVTPGCTTGMNWK